MRVIKFKPVERKHRIRKTVAVAISLVGATVLAEGITHAETYTSKTNPYSPSKELRTIAGTVISKGGSKLNQVKRLWSLLRDKMRFASRRNKLARTAAESLNAKRDCSGAMNTGIAGIRLLGVNVDVDLGSARGQYHIIPVAIIKGKRHRFDLQATSFGKTVSGFKRTKILTAKQARFIYHVEAGDYFVGKRKYKEAAKAYKKAIEYYDKDAYTWSRLGYVQNKLRDIGSADSFINAERLNKGKDKQIRRNALQVITSVAKYYQANDPIKAKRYWKALYEFTGEERFRKLAGIR